MSPASESGTADVEALVQFFKANSKFFKIEQSRPDIQPNFSKKSTWISLDFLGDVTLDIARHKR